MSDEHFAPWLKRWNLLPDGDAIHTHSSHLLPVRSEGRAAMLKVSFEAEEKLGGVLLTWWDGDGAAKVYANEGDALLIERAEGAESLLEMAHGGRDDEATRILCRAAAAIHRPRTKPPPEGLASLTYWFRSLEPAARTHGGILRSSLAAARELLASQTDIVPLHGDIHHGNILDFGDRGWLAIDPKRVLGDRGYDYANILCNPDIETATDPARLFRQLDVVLENANMPRRRVLQWVLAYAGLSAAWFFEDGEDASTDLPIAELAAAELKRIGGLP